MNKAIKNEYKKVDMKRLLYILGDVIFLKYVENCVHDLTIYERTSLDYNIQVKAFGFVYESYDTSEEYLNSDDLDIKDVSTMYISKVIERWI